MRLPILAVAILATACIVEAPPDAPELDVVASEPPTLGYSEPAPVEWSTVEVPRDLPCADDLVSKDAAELEGQHSAAPVEADEVPHARRWFHDERGLVAV